VFTTYVVAATLMILEAVGMPSMRWLAIDGLNPTGGFRACKRPRREAVSTADARCSNLSALNLPVTLTAILPAAASAKSRGIGVAHDR
jgi:hypothetical protein